MKSWSPPTRDKAVRGRPLQSAIVPAVCGLDTEAVWYDVYEAERLLLYRYRDALEDDRFDSTSILVRGFETLLKSQDEDFFRRRGT